MADLNPTDKLRQVLAHAYEGCRQLGADVIGTDHLLLGIVRHRNNVACEILGVLGADIEQIGDDLAASLHGGSKGGRPVITLAAKRALSDAEEEAQRREADCVGTDDLLCALLHQPSSNSAEVLRGSGITLERVLARLPKRSADRFTRL